MRFAILGPLEVQRNGVEVQFGGPKQRALLAVLLLAANEVVSRDQLVEALWGEAPPATAGRSLDSHVSRLRRVLGPDRLIRRAPGYALRVEPDELDLERFEALRARARATAAAGAHDRGAETLREALAIWRGPALADLLDEPFAPREAERLEELRLAAIEDRVDARLTAGTGTELVPELEGLVRRHPLRERPLGQLMLALYRDGRQAEALEAYGSARRRFATELGLEPGVQLRELETRILRQDPSLAPPRRAAAQARTSRRRKVAVAVALTGAGAIVAAVLVAGTGPSRAPPPGAGPHRLVAIDLRSHDPSAPTALPGAPAALAVAAGSVWSADADGESVARVAPESGAVVDRIPVRGQPASLAVAGGAVWAASTLGGTIQRIDPATGVVTHTTRLGADNVAAIAANGDSLWAADVTQRSLVEIDPRTGAIRATRQLDARPGAIAAGADAIWVADFGGSSVQAVDPRSGRVIARVHTGNGPAAIALGAGGVWVVNGLDSTVSRIDPRTDSVVATMAVGSGPAAVAVAGGSVWVASRYAGEVARIDPRTNRVAETFSVGGRPAALAAGGGRLWVGAGAAGAGHRGGTLRMVSPTPIPTIDPAFANLAEPLQFTRLAYDTLLTFETSSGPSGLRLVPDLALAIPTAGGGGTSFGFRVRRGIRYSDGRMLKASDFRRAIERLFRTGSPGADYYRGIVGAAACRAKPARCDLDRGISVDDRAGSITFHLTHPDPDFPFKLTVFGYSAPIPPGTADRDVGSDAVPGTGPYRIARRTAQRVEFERNPSFHEWSHAAQPDGNPDRIVWTTAPSSRVAAREVQRGRADWIYGLLPPDEVRRLRVGEAGQLHTNPSLLVEFIPLNTHRPPFDDVRVRRALSYAIDRDRIAHLYGGHALAKPTCQVLMPGMLGYRAYCPYTRGRSEVWSGTDVARARRLVAASGTSGQAVEVWGGTDNLGVPASVPRYVAGVLRSLGYRTRLRMVPLRTLTPELRRRIQISVDGDWLADYPAPSSFLPSFFGCGGGLSNGYVCDRALDRRMRIASSLDLRDPAAAAAAWARIDRYIARKAYWVPTVNPREPEFVSRRVSNYQYSPIWGFIADQAWVR